MPIVHIQILEGRTTEQKRALVERVTTVVSETIHSPAERVSVVIDEMKTENFAVGGILQSDK